MRRAVLLFAVLWAMLPDAAHAEGYVSLVGELSDGRRIAYSEEPPRSISVVRQSTSGGIEDSQTYAADACVMTLVYADATPDIRLLTCIDDGKTPLSGAQYIGRPYDGSCEAGDSQFEYTCIDGCGPGSQAPVTLRQGYWEC
jgi:hypothetical protein